MRCVCEGVGECSEMSPEKEGVCENVCVCGKMYAVRRRGCVVNGVR